MKPTVGRIVHYLPHSRAIEIDPQAAIITKVYRESGEEELGIVDLMIFPAMGSTHSQQRVPEGGPEDRGCWHWPEKVE